LLRHSVQISQHVGVREPKYNDTHVAKACVAQGVPLRVTGKAMLVSVDLDRQPQGCAVEIKDVRTDGMLPAKAFAFDLSSAELRPKNTLRGRGVHSKPPRAVGLFRRAVETGHRTDPLPKIACAIFVLPLSGGGEAQGPGIERSATLTLPP
jgi:hypothetical protein